MKKMMMILALLFAMVGSSFGSVCCKRINPKDHRITYSTDGLTVWDMVWDATDTNPTSANVIAARHKSVFGNDAIDTAITKAYLSILMYAQSNGHLVTIQYKNDGSGHILDMMIEKK